jgi:hypothetical protein
LAALHGSVMVPAAGSSLVEPVGIDHQNIFWKFSIPNITELSDKHAFQAFVFVEIFSGNFL